MDISILRYLDVLIGYTLILALASSIVTLLTQFMLQVRNRRSEYLRKGIAELLKRADPNLAHHAEAIAQAVLQWGGADGKPNDMRDVVEREQLIRRLLEFAKPSESVGAGVGAALNFDAARNALVKSLGGDKDTAGSLLAAIDGKAFQLEAADPKLASHVVNTQAIFHASTGEAATEQAKQFVNAIMARFDTMGEHASAAFTDRSRKVTFAMSLAVALVLPLDSVSLLKRLSSDDKLREAFVEKAVLVVDQAKPARLPEPGAGGGDAVQGEAPKNQSPAGAPGAGAASPGQSAAGAKPQEPVSVQQIMQAYQQLNDPRLSLSPDGWWPKIWRDGHGVGVLQTLIGCLLSALLMSIGAPFWYEALKNLLKLRPSLAKTDDAAREKRRKDETAQ